MCVLVYVCVCPLCSAAEDDAAHKRAMRAILANSQLKEIASAQEAEILALQQQLEQLKTRTFPMLTPSPNRLSPTAASPDLRCPPSAGHSPMASRAVAPARPLSVPAGKSKPMYGVGTGGSPAAGSPAVSARRPASGVLPPRPAGAPGSVVGSRVSSARRVAAAIADAAAPTGVLPPRPGTAATGSRRYDQRQ